MLEIDPVRRTCRAPMEATVGEVVAATLPHGLIPMIVPEGGPISVGEAIAGGALGAMSFTHGGFHDTCLDEGPRRATFRLVRARPFVLVQQERYRGVEDFVAAIHAHVARRDVDFMDGTIHSTGELALEVGRFADAGGTPTEAFLFRHDHGARSRWLRRLRPHRRRTALDVFVRISRLAGFLGWYERAVGLFPLGCLPDGHAGGDDELFVALALPGAGDAAPRHHCSEAAFWALCNPGR